MDKKPTVFVHKKVTPQLFTGSFSNYKAIRFKKSLDYN